MKMCDCHCAATGVQFLAVFCLGSFLMALLVVIARFFEDSR